MVASHRSQALRNVSAGARFYWEYRHLLFNLVARELKVRYRGSALGFAWSLVSPLLMTLIFTIVFGVLFPNKSTSVPFPAFVLVGILAWNFCAAAVYGSLGSIINNASIVTKVYFPRAILPLSTVLAGMINFLLAFLALVPVLIALGIHPTLSLVYLPLIILVELMFLTGLGLLLAVLNVLYRDTAQTVEVLMLAWFFLTPVFYDLDSGLSTATIGSVKVSTLVGILNPMASVITLYREVVLYGSAPTSEWLPRAIAMGCVALVGGTLIFARFSSRVGDEL